MPERTVMCGCASIPMPARSAGSILRRSSAIMAPTSLAGSISTWTLAAGCRIGRRAAFCALVVLVDMRGEALNPADDFILHSTIFCLDYVSRHIWGEVKGLPANAFQDLFAGKLRVLRLSRWDAA